MKLSKSITCESSNPVYFCFMEAGVTCLQRLSIVPSNTVVAGPVIYM